MSHRVQVLHPQLHDEEESISQRCTHCHNKTCARKENPFCAQFRSAVDAEGNDIVEQYSHRSNAFDPTFPGNTVRNILVHPKWTPTKRNNRRGRVRTYKMASYSDPNPEQKNFAARSAGENRPSYMKEG